jgi:hypothetical protein
MYAVSGAQKLTVQDYKGDPTGHTFFPPQL